MLAVALVAAALGPLGSPPPQVAKVTLSPRPHALRIYLAPVTATIRGRLDSRLHFVGVLPRGRRKLVFVVPPLDTGTYRIWCKGCTKRVLVRVRTTGDPCWVTRGRTPYGNGLLSTSVLVEGLVVIGPNRVTERGLWWTKLGWSVKPWSVNRLDLSVVLTRLDGPASVRRVESVLGDNGWSWAARMYFPSEGCYRVTGRVEDVALSFVVQVVRS